MQADKVYHAGAVWLTGQVHDAGVFADGVLRLAVVDAQVGVTHAGDPDAVPVPLLVPLEVRLVQRGTLDAVPRHLARWDSDGR